MTESLGFISRRRWLKWSLRGLGAVAAVAAGGGGLLLSLRGCAPDVSGLTVLGAHQYRTLANLARVSLPAGGPFAAGADDFDLARLFDGYLADEPAANAEALSLALHWIEFGPVVHDGRAKTFSNLPAAEQLAHWESWAVADDVERRMVSIALRKFLNLVFYDQPEVWPHLGYPGPSAA